MNPRQLAWSLSVVLGAGTLVAVLALRDDRAAPRPHHAPASPNGASERGDQALQRALELTRDPALSRTRLVELYGEAAGDPSAVPARKLVLAALFSQENIPSKLSSVLAAVEADPTPAARDPLWQDLVGMLAEVWRGDTLTRGLDLMAAESRPRAKRALIASFAAIATSDRLGELTPPQRETLGNRLIDLYHSLPEDQKPEVEAALRKAVGDDVADIARGKGLKNDNELALQRNYNQAKADAPKAVAEAAREAPEPLAPGKDRGE